MPESKDGEGAVDLSTLRTFRVLRPLKLVSGVPSKSFNSEKLHLESIKDLILKVMCQWSELFSYL